MTVARLQAPLLTLTFLASGAVSASRAIGFNGAQATVRGQKIMGVNQRAVTDAKYSDATLVGTATIETGGAFAVGDSLIVDDSGRAIASAGAISLKAGATAVTSTAANGAAILQGGDLPEFVFADAMESSGGVGDFVEVLLRR
jgi:hypothetical protein